MATLHHQLVYRLQNHALDLPTPQTSSDALMILADSETVPSIVQIPRQIQKQELLKLMPLKWLSNYEKFHQNSQPVQTSDAPFEKRKNMPIHGFASDGYLIYPNKINGRFLWDVPVSHMCDPGCPCLEEEDDDDFNRRPRSRKKKSHRMEPCQQRPHLPPDDPDNTTLLPIYKKGLRLIRKEYQQKPCRQEADQPSMQPPPIQSSMMFSSTCSHSSESEDTSSDQESSEESLKESHFSSDSKIELADISKLLIVQPSTGSNDPSPSSSPPTTPIVEEAKSDTNPTASSHDNPPKPSNGPWFTFDDIPKMLRTGATSQTVLKEFSSRFTGSRRDWFESLGQYRQLQLVQAEISQVLGIIYEQFLGEATAANEQTRREFHQMKCCSLQIKDLDFHYKRMSTMYYKFNGFNDPSLKHVFIVSLPKEIQPKLQRQFTIHQLDIANLSLGKIYQLAVN
ncbi:hypothetical protein KPL71_012034 [Citrus sinensis]|uniref:Uncharacterized protein n=1 Tax=Citrus sinensis TaxID=2711 RepID=A0ACB8L7X6_CITSI|nr:hypothetical protein KPL71_012034 [Citrus sinensis]